MYRRIDFIALVVSAGLILALWAGPVSAQNGANNLRREAVRERAEKWSALTRGAAFNSQGQSYVLLPEVRAAASAPGPVRAGALSIAPTDVLEKKGKFLIYRDTAGGAQGATLSGAGLASTHPVVLNERTGQFGVLSGAVVARLHNISQAEAVASAHGLQVSSVATGIRYAYFEPAHGGDLIAALAALGSDSRVESAYLDILENVKIPQ